MTPKSGTKYERRTSDFDFVHGIKLIDILLRRLTKRVKRYLRDTTDFLNHVPSDVPENTLLATFDVELILVEKISK